MPCFCIFLSSKDLVCNLHCEVFILQWLEILNSILWEILLKILLWNFCTLHFFTSEKIFFTYSKMKFQLIGGEICLLCIRWQEQNWLCIYIEFVNLYKVAATDGDITIYVREVKNAAQIRFINLCMTWASVLCKFQEYCEKENFSFPVFWMYHINSNLNY